MKPQLAKPAKPADLTKNRHWHTEPKLDGFRSVIRKRGDEVFIYLGRNGSRVEEKLPRLVEAASKVPFDFTLDGELVYVERWETVSGKDVPVVQFHRVAEVMKSNTPLAIRKQRTHPLTFVAFDCLDARGVDMYLWADASRRPLTESVAGYLALAGGEVSPIARWCSYKPNVVAELVGAGLEGAVIKNPVGHYREDYRSGDWLKIKATDTADVVVMDFKPGKGKFEGLVGAIIFGQYRNGKLEERGACSGMTDVEREELTKVGLRALKDRVIEVKFFGVSGADREGLRHPQFLRVREPFDKRAEDCLWEAV